MVTQKIQESRLANLSREDQALDQLLRNARMSQDAAPPSGDLVGRITSARITSATKVTADIEHTGITPADRKARVDREWIAAAALLAASLVLGVFIGSTDVGRTTTETVGTIAGFTTEPATVQTSALDVMLTIQDDEERL